MLTVDTPNLELKLVCNLLEFFPVATQIWQSNVDRCSEGCTKIGRARCDVTKAWIMGEPHVFVYLLDASGKPLEHPTYITTHLH